MKCMDYGRFSNVIVVFIKQKIGKKNFVVHNFVFVCC